MNSTAWVKKQEQAHGMVRSRPCCGRMLECVLQGSVSYEPEAGWWEIEPCCMGCESSTRVRHCPFCGAKLPRLPRLMRVT